MSRQRDPKPTIENHQQAFAEISFLLEIFASTVDNLMGGATASVGRIAGRNMARKMPFYLTDPVLADVLDEIARRMSHGFAITCAFENGGANLCFGKCVIRDACKVRGLQPGTALCRLFHAYLDGVVNEILYRPVKSSITSAADTCAARMEVR